MGFWWIGPAITIPLGFGIPAILASVVAAELTGFIVAPEHMAQENRERWEREGGWQERERRRMEREREEREENRRLLREANMKPNLGAVLRQNHEIYWKAKNDEWRDYVDSHRRPV